jgi:hypothetical protein
MVLMVKGKKLTPQQRYYRKHKGKYRKYAKKYRKQAKEKLEQLEREKLLNETKEEKLLRKKEISLKRKKIRQRKHDKQQYLRRKRATYFIATIKNNKPYKIINRYVEYSWASKKWDEVLEQQQNIFYPGFQYPLMFLYKVKIGEENTIVQRNKLGKLIETTIPGFRIIFHDTYYTEKNVFFKNKRQTVPAHFILKLLNINDNIKQCFLIKNKICIEDEGKYFLFSCTDVQTAIGIKNRLREKILAMDKTNILFFNDVSSISMKNEIYDKIIEQGICNKIYLIRNDF